MLKTISMAVGDIRERGEVRRRRTRAWGQVQHALGVAVAQHAVAIMESAQLTKFIKSGIELGNIVVFNGKCIPQCSRAFTSRRSASAKKA